MATVPQTPASTMDQPDAERTINALVSEGKLTEAQTEFERLCLEGLDSGEATSMTPSCWNQLRAELHAEAKLEH